MVQHFLVELTDVLDDDSVFARVVAPDATTAITTFLHTFAPTDPAFLSYVYSTTINLSFAERFWIQTDDEDDLFEQGLLQQSDEVIIERVQQFFGAHHDYADLYLTYYFNADSGEVPRLGFPPEMLTYIWQYTMYGEVRAFPVGDG